MCRFVVISHLQGRHAEKHVGNWGVMGRASGIRWPRQSSADVLHTESGKLVRHTVSVLDMAASHNTDD